MGLYGVHGSHVQPVTILDDEMHTATTGYCWRYMEDTGFAHSCMLSSNGLFLFSLYLFRNLLQQSLPFQEFTIIAILHIGTRASMVIILNWVKHRINVIYIRHNLTVPHKPMRLAIAFLSVYMCTYLFCKCYWWHFNKPLLTYFIYVYLYYFIARYILVGCGAWAFDDTEPDKTWRNLHMHLLHDAAGPGRPLPPSAIKLHRTSHAWHTAYTYLHASGHTYIHTVIYTYIHTYTCASIHPSIHTYIHTYMHTHFTHTSVQPYTVLECVSCIFFIS